MEITEIHLCSYLRMSAQSTQDFLRTKEIIRTVFNAVKPIQPYATSYEKQYQKTQIVTLLTYHPHYPLLTPKHTHTLPTTHIVIH